MLLYVVVVCGCFVCGFCLVVSVFDIVGGFVVQCVVIVVVVVGSAAATAVDNLVMALWVVGLQVCLRLLALAVTAVAGGGYGVEGVIVVAGTCCWH